MPPLTIIKYPLNMAGRGELFVSMPEGATLLKVNGYYVWALVDQLKPMQNMRFFIYATGDSVNTEEVAYVDTILQGNDARHLFMEKRSSDS